MKISEKISLILLILLFSLGVLTIVIVPFSKNVSAMCLSGCLFIFLFGFVPMFIYGIISLIAYVFFDKKI